MKALEAQPIPPFSIQTDTKVHHQATQSPNNKTQHEKLSALSSTTKMWWLSRP